MDRPGEFFEVRYPIAADVARQDGRVTVRFQAHPDATAGGIFGLRVEKAGSAGDGAAPRPPDPVGAAAPAPVRLLWHLDARDLAAGGDAWIDRAAGARFERLGRPKAEDVAGVRAAVLDGKGDGFRGPIAPPELTGAAPRSVEVCVLNPRLEAEEPMVAWGRRGGPAGTNFSFNCGASPAFGALTHWAADIGWKTPPEPGAWHHLACTFDGRAARLYMDGRPAGERAVAPATAAGFPILHRRAERSRREASLRQRVRRIAPRRIDGDRLGAHPRGRAGGGGGAAVLREGARPVGRRRPRRARLRPQRGGRSASGSPRQTAA